MSMTMETRQLVGIIIMCDLILSLVDTAPVNRTETNVPLFFVQENATLQLPGDKLNWASNKGHEEHAMESIDDSESNVANKKEYAHSSEVRIAMSAPPVLVKEYIRAYTHYKLYPKLAESDAGQAPGSNLMVVPLAVFFVFLIGVGIKATHWWNEDIRQADGLLVNVYTPYKAPRRVLARIYSTEPSDEDTERDNSLRRKHSRKDPRPGKVLLESASNNVSQSSLFSYNQDEEGDFGACDNRVVGAYRTASVRSKARSTKWSASAGNRSPTESVCSRCRYIESLGTRYNERDIVEGHFDPDLLEMYRTTVGSQSHHVHRLKRQLSNVSTQSTGTIRSEACSESAPLLLAGASTDRLNRQVTHRESNTRTKAPNNVGKATLVMKKPPNLRRLSPLASRANSESHISQHRARQQTTTNGQSDEDPTLKGINALLKNSLNLNINLLNSMSISASNHMPMKVFDVITPVDGATDSGVDKSPNHTPQGSASCLSNSDMASSTSAGTSVTALYSSVSSNGSLSRQNSKKYAHFLHGKHFLQFEENSKAMSDPSLKVSTRKADAVVFTIGEEKLELQAQNKRQLRRSWSGYEPGDWKGQSGRYNYGLCRSVSMDTVHGSKRPLATSDKSIPNMNKNGSSVFFPYQTNNDFQTSDTRKVDTEDVTKL